MMEYIIRGVSYERPADAVCRPRMATTPTATADPGLKARGEVGIPLIQN